MEPVSTRPAAHSCRDHLDYIGGWPPYECLVCGKRLSALDIEDDAQPTGSATSQPRPPTDQEGARS